MKATSHIDYKALYKQSQLENKEQQKRIVLLQKDLTSSVQKQQQLALVVSQQQQTILDKEAFIQGQQSTIASQEQTIQNQILKISQQDEMITSLDRLVLRQEKELAENRKDLDSLHMIKHELRTLKKLLYGRKSEKHYPSEGATEQQSKPGEQLTLGIEVDALGIREVVASHTIAKHERKKVVTTRTAHPGRHDFPKGLREVITELYPDNVPEGAVLLRFEDTRQLACQDMELFINVSRRYFYLAPGKEEDKFRQLVAPLPAHPIARCKADVSLLIKLIIDKFVYHLPTWRQQARFRQYGIDLKYTTLSGWINRIADLLEPIYTALLHELTISGYLMMDETTYRVLDTEKQKGKKSHIGYLWTCSNPLQKMVVFSYHKGRGKKEVAHILARYRGYLQTDGYAGYTNYGRQPGVVHLQCMAHTRRYFSESRDHDLKRSDHALEQFFAPLYRIEREAKAQNLSYDEITDKGAKESEPVLVNFYTWLQDELPKLIPGTPIHKAVTYTLNRFKELSAYVSDGMLEIDNNFTERQIRPITLGRRNYLFAGSHRGGERAAIIYSLLGTCKLQGIDPRLWLTDVLCRLNNHPSDKLMELLPQFWKPVGKEVKSA